jgi:quinol-cytochrome oxidoreductase complex cytochrome b subunit
MVEALPIVVFLAFIVGLAALILVFIDRLPLQRNLSDEERKEVVGKRTERWQRRWGFFIFIAALLALFVSVLNPDHESTNWRVIRFVIAALIVLGYLRPRKGDD